MITGDNKFATKSTIEIPFDFDQYKTLNNYKRDLQELTINSIHTGDKLHQLLGELQRTESFLKKYQNIL